MSVTARSAQGVPSDSQPIDLKAFSKLMAALAPFEPKPHVAAAVSGGADSLALAVLLRDWNAVRGGHVTALIVDHGLRPESAEEARITARSLLSLGLDVEVLTWRGPKPSANVQAASRTARYRMLTGWCERHGVLHLALGHHRDDQAETFLLRLGRGSGLDGLAGMAPVVELPGVRLLRPLLGVPRSALEAALRTRGIEWVDDPSNRDRTHARIRIRQLKGALAREGLTSARLTATATHLARARSALESVVCELLGAAAVPDPVGFVWLDPEPFSQAPREVRLRALARLLSMVGGLDYAPRLKSLERLEGRILADLRRGATLGGCRILPKSGRLLLVREAAAASPTEVRPGQRLIWDGRFDISLGRPRKPVADDRLAIGALGSTGWAAIARSVPDSHRNPVPPAARAAIPALFDGRGVREIPAFAYLRGGEGPKLLQLCQFSPQYTLTSARFTVA